MKRCILAGVIVLSMAACGGGGDGDGGELFQSSALSGPANTSPPNSSIGGTEAEVKTLSEEPLREDASVVGEGSDPELTLGQVGADVADASSSGFSASSKQTPSATGVVIARLFDFDQYLISREEIKSKVAAAMAGTDKILAKKREQIKRSFSQEKRAKGFSFSDSNEAMRFGTTQFTVHEIIYRLNENGALLPLNTEQPSKDFRTLKEFNNEGEKQKLRLAKRLIVLYKKIASDGSYSYIVKCLRYKEYNDEIFSGNGNSEENKEGWYQISSDNGSSDWEPLVLDGENVINVDEWLESDIGVRSFIHFDANALKQRVLKTSGLDAQLTQELIGL
ncbi:Uncharacterized protein MCB1EB_0197 [Mycoavidus cysteinexigens]|uniref:Uncharacterized protein n=1 Tax=Mycoavidus cysteinexigens TaxID=1553431 RepID=A0A2Z6ESI9_9BURK|nr:hypothetical protein [Mycoavidus cysteinexigens]BBE08358.1 Uncharacterized protein MCB1EB_0197 [Mycoavidus cysteinexigens]GAM52939.1 hypothetical protein EBME_1402 [bacterium endosymbiont of Mortierella elongata FMR23-6]GLR00864.1 hypothetical protein GCM10007934_06760 [Mycoavidus cysteinexigens]